MHNIIPMLDVASFPLLTFLLVALFLTQITGCNLQPPLVLTFKSGVNGSQLLFYTHIYMYHKMQMCFSILNLRYMFYFEKPRNMIPLCNTWHLGLSLKITDVL